MTKARNLSDLLDANGDVKSGALDNVPASDLVNDTTPQLGGNLDLNSNNITGTGNIPAANLTGTLPAIDGSSLTGISAGMSYVTTSSTTTTSTVYPSGSFSNHLTRSFTVSSGKSATVIVTAGLHGLWEGSAGQIQGRITLSGASSATGISVGGQRGNFDNYGGEFSISQGFRVTTSGSHTVNFQVREINGEVRINEASGETSYLTITVFED